MIMVLVILKSQNHFLLGKDFLLTKEYDLILAQLPISLPKRTSLVYNMMLAQYKTDALVVALIDNDYTPELENELNSMKEKFKEYDNIYFISATGNALDIMEDDTLFEEFYQIIKDSKDIPLDDYELDEAFVLQPD